ncbi:hypothetical protein EYF80_029287 [Liparis tanakae]|uniref:Uncharacterized protein n=1 Tax=Liparis tanakae TaxID=230148 RepID=A0A4Z2H3P5_9TELE|nr:hypothetical protein EYF80_029287 [Liparis tanakae]
MNDRGFSSWDQIGTECGFLCLCMIKSELLVLTVCRNMNRDSFLHLVHTEEITVDFRLVG